MMLTHRQVLCLVATLPGVLALGCSDRANPTVTRALSTSGDVALVCLERGDDGTFRRGAPLGDCPDPSSGIDSPRLHALVTQPETGEVAVVDLSTRTPSTLDFDPTQPGYSFLPVGAQPGDIVSTPGGVGTFVATLEAGREGIFGLPASCLHAEESKAETRDLTIWPGCSLPSAPGPLALLIDPPRVEAGSPTQEQRASCQDPYADAATLVGASPGAQRTLCPGDLAVETSPPGRRKLAVAMPNSSEIWIIDAQAVLDRAPGSFDPCVAEVRYPLAPAPGPAPSVDSSTLGVGPECLPPPSAVPMSRDLAPRPVDFALSDSGELFVADRQAPVIHRLDARDPCALRAEPPLLPTSFTDPSSVITTRRLAVSPLTTRGQRFVYAIDDSRSRSAGSVMVFDVSPESTSQTPLLLDRARFNPSEPPDRIRLPGAATDVEFVFQDVPVPDPVSGAYVDGVRCSPDPALTPNDLEARYRSADVLGQGRMRGTFAYIALPTGALSVVDVDDLDADCRRPVTTNRTGVEGTDGCLDPEDAPALYLRDNVFTTSGEASCRVVQPHRERSASLFGGVNPPRVTLTLGTGRGVVNDLSVTGRNYPRLLPVQPPSAVPLQPAALDPSLAENNSLLLTYEEPRAHVRETATATFEGVLQQGLGELRIDAEGRPHLDVGVNGALCSSGVHDTDAIVALGAKVGLEPENAPEFALRHGDYVQWLGTLAPEDDEYWSPGSPGASCGAALFQQPTAAGNGRALCDQFFGPAGVPPVERELRVLEAYDSTLVLTPRAFENASVERRRQVGEFLACCFPRPSLYRMRVGRQWLVQGSVSRSPHPIETAANSGRCVTSCNPIISEQSSRVFEVSCVGSGCTAARPDLSPGTAVDGEDFVCRVTNLEGGLDPQGASASCAHRSLTKRFAIYRGQAPSERDMRFQWNMQLGFSPLTVPLEAAGDRPRASPVRLRFSRELRRLFVPDGTARGLAWVRGSEPDFAF